jgi:hypothetical protein
MRLNRGVSITDSQPSMYTNKHGYSFRKPTHCRYPRQQADFECYVSHSTSAVSPSSWKAQRAVVHSFNSPGELSKMNIPTGVTSPPRDYPSPSIPRHGSLVFHPTEMLYGVGGPDGTGESEQGRFFLHKLNGSLVSAHHWLQAPLAPIAQRPLSCTAVPSHFLCIALL